MNILLVISSLGSGGAERVMSLMANYWANERHRVTLVTLDKTGNDFYLLSANVSRIGLDLLCESNHTLAALANNFSRTARLRKTIKEVRPDVVISFMEKTNILTILATSLLPVTTIISERTDPRFHQIGSIWTWLRNRIYQYAYALVVQTNGVWGWASFRFRNCKIEVIPNPVVLPPSFEEATHSQSTETTVVAIGRLDRYKGFDILINAFSQCVTDRPEWRLVILGEGPERKELERLLHERDLVGRVELPGRVQDVFPILSKAALFVLSSRYEGFPNALIEAMACGLPVIATDCPSGPAEIITNGVDGVLVPIEDVHAMAEAMGRLMDSNELRAHLASAAVNIRKRLSIHEVMRKWDALLREGAA